MNKNLKANKKVLDDIFRYLVEEVNLYEGLADTVQKKQTAIIENNVAALNKYSGAEQAIIKKGNTLTKNRMKMINDSDSEQSSFIEFLTKYSLLDNQEWSKLQSRLNLAVAKIRRSNTENAMLLKTSLDFVQSMVKLYYPKSVKAENTYTKEGKTATRQTNVFDYGI